MPGPAIYITVASSPSKTCTIFVVWMNEWTNEWVPRHRALFIHCTRHFLNPFNATHLFFFFKTLSFFPVFSSTPANQMLERMDWLPVCLILIYSLILHAFVFCSRDFFKPCFLSLCTFFILRIFFFAVFWVFPFHSILVLFYGIMSSQISLHIQL